MVGMTIRTWEQAESAFSQTWPDFRPRPQQRTLAHGVTQTVHGNSRNPRLLAQAGCGVGKSIGYLVPAIASGKRIVVAVSTRALQDQLYRKDLPTLRDTLFPDLTFSVLKGRGNYLCLRAADKTGNTYTFKPDALGERADLVEDVTDEWWREMTVDAEGCVGRKACQFSDQCYSELAKARTLASQVRIVNTSLLTQDLRLRAMTRGKASLLGDFDVLIVDEAHEMADIVASGLSSQVTLRRIVDTTSKLTYHLDGKDTPSQVELVNYLSIEYFNSAQYWFRQQKNDVRTAELSNDDYQKVLQIIAALVPLSDKVRKAQCSCEPVVDPETGDEDLKCEYARRVTGLMNDLTLFTEVLSSENVQWLERGLRDTVALKASPAEVGGWLNAALWDPEFEEPKKAILTSATLGIGGDFTYIARRLGIRDYDDLDVGSPFDFDHQARLYLPLISEPSPKRRDEWKPWARQRMKDLIAASDGDALVLFTSVSAMREAYDELSFWCKQTERPPLMQGNGVDNRTLADQYAKTPHAVLFATRSFMTGVDFPGKKLVVIDKMPFPVPDEPVFKARCKAVEQKFGERASFGRVSIPEMSLVLVQAFGRMIRNMDDRGVVAILDSRMRAGWARPIRASLPPAPTVASVEEVIAFYESIGVR